MLIAGIQSVVGVGGGLYWLVAVLVVGFSWALANSWPLVVWLPTEADEP